MSTTWLQISFSTNKDQAEEHANLLTELGAKAVTFLGQEQEEILEPEPDKEYMWEKATITGLFTQEDKAEQIIEILQKILPETTCTLAPLEEKDWSETWKQDLQPMLFANKLWIYPSWIDSAKNSPYMILDPGMAFGTGTHNTTRLCLNWLAETKLHKLTVIDYGCGSGILAIAAALLGANKIIAIDYDKQALISTVNNAKINNVADKISVMLPEQLPSVKADVIIANILMGPLLELKTIFYKLLNNSGKIVLSGILDRQEKILVNEYKQLFHIDEVAKDGNWLRIIASKKD